MAGALACNATGGELLLELGSFGVEDGRKGGDGARSGIRRGGEFGRLGTVATLARAS